MKELLGQRVLVSKLEEPKTEGFQSVQVQDSFIYKGIVRQVGELNTSIKVGSVVLFAKYSPDTQEVELDGEKMKIISYSDIIGIL